MLERTWFTGSAWRLCLLAGCPITNQDWGADSLTYDLYLRWQTTHDRSLVPSLRRLSGSMHVYRACRRQGSRSHVPGCCARRALRFRRGLQTGMVVSSMARPLAVR
jgi:hypothetical protein